MKKTFKTVLTFSLVLFTVSCSELELKNSGDSTDLTEFGTTMTAATSCCAVNWPVYQDRLRNVSRHNFTQFGEYVGAIRLDGQNPPEYAYLNPWKESVYNLENLADNAYEWDVYGIASDIASEMGPNPYAPGGKTYHHMLDDDFVEFGSLLTWYQKDILDNYLTQMESITSASDAITQYNNAINAIESTLYGDDRTETRAIVEIVHAGTLEYLSYNQDVIIFLENETERMSSSGCEIRWRDAFREGVWGFFAGAATGAIWGGAGGTVVLPGIGTITGALGVGVWGAFAGYAGGVAGSVARQWFWNCLLQSPMQTPSGLDCTNFEFAQRNQEYCFDVEPSTPNLIWYLANE